MSLQENLAAAMRTIMEQKQKSLTEFSVELDISRNALYDYLRGKGNPSIATLEHIADKLNVMPAFLMLGLFEQDEREVVLVLLNTIQKLSELPPEKRLKFAELFLEMVALWNES